MNLSELKKIDAHSLDKARLQNLIDSIAHSLATFDNPKDHLKLLALKQFFESELKLRDQ